MTVIAASGTSWTDIMTAFGTAFGAVATFGAVVVAIWIALRSDRETNHRIEAEHKRSDQLLEDERAHGRAQIEEERRIAREREQLAEAYAVQVVAAETPIRFAGDQGTGKQLAAIIVNRGKFTITRIEAQFSPDGMSLIPHFAYKRMPGFDIVPDDLRAGWQDSSGQAMYRVLTPWDKGIRFATDTVHDKFLKSPYPVVRWTDRWGARWEHKRGEVHQVRDDEQWSP